MTFDWDAFVDAVAWNDVIKVFVIVVAALVGIWLARRAIGLATRSVIAQRRGDDESLITQADLERRMKTLETLADRLAAIVIGLIALLMVLSQFDVDIGPAIAGLGVVGIAVGFGAQTLVRDWLAGIFIVIENQYSVGDVVSIAGVDGVVEGFSLRRTVLRNLDGTVHNVPNGQIVVASNMTRGFARVNVDVSVAYDTDIDRASAVINRIGEEMQNDPAWADKIIEPPAVMRVNALGDSSVALKVLGQVKPAQQWAVSGELRKRVLAAFAAEGIEIPFPHQVLISRGQGSNGESRSRAEIDQPASEG
ncbi:MAG TPA: mechanosensitive ion channel family protein [Candidatus Limnocylindria bacterium]